MGIFRRRSKDLFTISEQAPAASAAAAPPTASGGFRMVVTDCFFITGRGMVVTGKVETGTVSIGDRVTFERAGQAIGVLDVAAIERFRKRADTAAAGESVGLLFRGIAKGQIVQGIHNCGRFYGHM
jgi:translation elongation factor EF-Tu-like GTPase